MRAQEALKTAIDIDPTLAISSLNLADVYQHEGRESDAQALIETVLKRDSQNALATHALGLSLLRQKRVGEAVQALGKASRLDPQNARFAYVYALILESTGQRAEAIRKLEAALKLHSDDWDALQTLVAFCRKVPDAACVQKYEERIATLR